MESLPVGDTWTGCYFQTCTGLDNNKMTGYLLIHPMKISVHGLLYTCKRCKRSLIHPMKISVHGLLYTCKRCKRSFLWNERHICWPINPFQTYFHCITPPPPPPPHPHRYSNFHSNFSVTSQLSVYIFISILFMMPALIPVPQYSVPTAYLTTGNCHTDKDKINITSLSFVDCY